MAFADPQSVTIDSDVVSLPRISTGENRSVYRNEDASIEMSVSHTYGKRNRRALRFTLNKVAIDPLIPSTNVPYSMSVTLVVDAPIVGFSVDEQEVYVAAIAGYLAASSGANATKFLGGQS